jgi:tetratricopeptide (TPR) repeat protein
VSSAVALGRQELFRGQNQDALESFEVAARADPGYSFGVDRSEGVFSYLGRAQYLNGQYAQARQSLERDLARDPGNSLSRLYLGLTQVRLNERIPASALGRTAVTPLFNDPGYYKSDCIRA